MGNSVLSAEDTTLAPSAEEGDERSLGGRLSRATDVLVALTIADLRSRYGRGAWRLVKWLLDPFALVGVYLLLVSIVLDRGGSATGLSLACAVVPFQLVMGSIINALTAANQRRSILLNMSFDRSLIPISSVLTETIAFAASLLLLALMMAVYAIAPTLAILWLPVVIAVTILFSIGAAYPISLVGLWFPDLRVFFISFVRAMFFLAPGLVALSAIEGTANTLVRLNPLTGLFEAYRDVLLYGQAPSPWELLVPLAYSVVLLACFVPLYRSEAHHFAKVVE